MAIVLIIIGLCSGVLSGMGLGGGLIMIPALTIFMSAEQVPAQGMNLLAFLPAAGAAVIQYARSRRIEWRIVLFVGGIAMIGAIGGALLVGVFEDYWLKIGYCVLLIGFGIQQIVTAKK